MCHETTMNPTKTTIGAGTIRGVEHTPLLWQSGSCVPSNRQPATMMWHFILSISAVFLCAPKDSSSGPPHKVRLRSGLYSGAVGFVQSLVWQDSSCHRIAHQETPPSPTTQNQLRVCCGVPPQIGTAVAIPAIGVFAGPPGTVGCSF